MLTLLPLGRVLADPAIKPAIVGLISTGSATNTLAKISTDAAKGIFGGLVIQANWKDLEPEENKLNTKIIEDALTNAKNDNVTDYNNNEAQDLNAAPNNRQLGVRLRIFAGCSGGKPDAPTWAMKKDAGFPISVTAEYDGKVETCELGEFWNTNSNYAKAWRNFQKQLAAVYDSNALIREVSVTSCTSFSAEPFFLNLKHPRYDAKYPAPNPVPPLPADALGAAGFTDEAYLECLTNAIDDYAPWQTTRLEFSFNEFSGLGKQDDVAASELIMRRCRLTIGQRCILSNHDLDTKTPLTILPVYVFERKFGPNITFQSLHVTPTDYEGTLRKGVSLGASSIEIWQEPQLGSFEQQSRLTLVNWASMFEPQ